MVGAVPMGGGADISIQSMVNVNTCDVDAAVAQIHSLEQAGCDIARIAVCSKADASALRKIKDRVSIPLVADIQFDYKLAIAAAENGADKLRFNPGNIGAQARVRALVACAKAHDIPIRIGVNAGSLDKQLLKKFKGPTPDAMVESALFHIGLLEQEGFFDIVVSLKASNVPDTVSAYRKIHELVQYPLHIGVTEAGMGEFALIKSSIGIGALLLEGIGDTLRVSLTGAPELEVAAGRDILRACGLRREGVEIVSCPTCGRCKVDLPYMVKTVENRLPKECSSLTIAVMGCAVNGPGEAREADIGIAFGENSGVLFKKGTKIASGTPLEVVDKLVNEVSLMC